MWSHMMPDLVKSFDSVGATCISSLWKGSSHSWLSLGTCHDMENLDYLKNQGRWGAPIECVCQIDPNSSQATNVKPLKCYSINVDMDWPHVKDANDMTQSCECLHPHTASDIFSAGKLVCSIDGPKLGFGHFANLSCFTTFAALATAFATFATFAATFATFVAFLSAFGRLFCPDFSKLFATGPLVPVANVTGVLAHHLLLKSVMTTWKHQFNNSTNGIASFLKLHTSLEP